MYNTTHEVKSSIYFFSSLVFFIIFFRRFDIISARCIKSEHRIIINYNILYILCIATVARGHLITSSRHRCTWDSSSHHRRHLVSAAVGGSLNFLVGAVVYHHILSLNLPPTRGR